MTQEQEDLLLKDLCARFKYGVIVVTPKGRGYVNEINFTIFGYELGVNIDPLIRDTFSINDVKPYLFPLSSMTDKDLTEFLQIKGMNLNSDELKDFRDGKIAIASSLSTYSKNIDWLNAHRIDYRGLIEKGLAIDATNLNIY